MIAHMKGAATYKELKEPILPVVFQLCWVEFVCIFYVWTWTANEGQQVLTTLDAEVEKGDWEWKNHAEQNCGGKPIKKSKPLCLD